MAPISDPTIAHRAAMARDRPTVPAESALGMPSGSRSTGPLCQIDPARENGRVLAHRNAPRRSRQVHRTLGSWPLFVSWSSAEPAS